VVKQIKKILLVGLPIIGLPVLIVNAAASQEGWDPDGLGSSIGGKGLSTRTVPEILLTVIDWALVIIGLLGVITFIYAGFIYLTAQGKDDEIERAKKILIWAVVGIAVAVLGYVVVKTINDLLVGGGAAGAGGGGANSGGYGSGSPTEPAAPPSGSLPTTSEMVQ
jgi:hypothetical protein